MSKDQGTSGPMTGGEEADQQGLGGPRGQQRGRRSEADAIFSWWAHLGLLITDSRGPDERENGRGLGFATGPKVTMDVCRLQMLGGGRAGWHENRGWMTRAKPAGRLTHEGFAADVDRAVMVVSFGSMCRGQADG